MHNWWIAALEEFGLITREEAQHISQEIRLTTHRENYKEAFEELHIILGDRKITQSNLLEGLKNDIAILKNELRALQTKDPIKKIVASKK